MPRSDAPEGSTLLVDGHVHVYPSYALPTVLASAVRNFGAGARELGVSNATGCLLLTETPAQHAFRAWRDAAGREFPDGWMFSQTAEDCSLQVLHRGELRLVVIAGRQIATSEGLEVLATGCDREFPRSPSLPAAVDAARAALVPPVIPWGFGKWWFRRGDLVAAELERSGTGVFLGDNGGRWRGSRSPALFEAARERGIFTLPGSDPLPFEDQQVRVGSYGFALSGVADLDRPAEQVGRAVRQLASQPAGFGQREGLVAFTRNQFMMQVKKGRN